MSSFEVNTIEQIRRIFTIFQSSNTAIRPHFFLTGPSGCGKTHTIETMAEQLGITMFEIKQPVQGHDTPAG